ncbi:MAG: dat 1 [Geminicoccaceae bacterium]|nr:dat 1 [Geminicoccaceae bacterium]
MARIAYVNGRYRPLAGEAIALEDRGYQFADGVYEVIKVLAGRPRDLERHLDRLQRSLAALEIAAPMSRAALTSVLFETLRRNRLRDALLYVQVTRGTAPRNHVYPKRVRPSLVVTARKPGFPSARERAEGVGVITLPDLRWGRCDIKSISLLPNVMARQQAAAAGCREAWLVDQAGRVTEGSASNAYIVDQGGRLVTHPLSERILGGITRSVVLELARADGIPVVERPFSVAEAQAAREAALSSTSSMLLPVTAIDERTVGNGHPGSVVRRLLELYDGHLQAAARC